MKTVPKALVFDLDGTLYLGNEAIDGAVAKVKQLALQLPVFYLTNNTSKTPEQYATKLHAMGFPSDIERIVSPLDVAVQLLRESGWDRVWLQANDSVLAWMRQKLPGIDLRPSFENTQAVLLAYDDTLDFHAMCQVNWRLMQGAAYWITHPDTVCPGRPGPLPDVGAFVKLFEASAGRIPQRVLGKPDPLVLGPVLERCTGLELQDIHFVGDRLYTDWELSRRAKCGFSLVLSGETTSQQLENLKKESKEIPQTILESVCDLHLPI